MAALPIEIITEILSRLPVKPVLRFQCVCKSWQSLIKTPNFIKIHLNQTLISNSDRHLLIFRPSLHSAELDLRHNHISFSELHQPLSHTSEEVHLFGSCNGIICIADDSKNDIFLYNPLTKSHRKLPVNQFFKPSKCFMLFGFGYDSKNDDYKVLRLIQGVHNYESFNEAQVYSLNNNLWKSIKNMPYYICYGDCHGVLVNQALHYIVLTKGPDPPVELIASFDIRTESFSVFDFPNYNDGTIKSNMVKDLMELGGCLCVLFRVLTHTIHAFHPDNLCILDRADLWVMKEYGNKESWIRLYSISLPEIRVWCVAQMRPIIYSRDGRRILCQIDGMEFGWYDLESKNVEILTPHGLPDTPLETGIFVGSLVSVENKLHSGRKTLPSKDKNKIDVGNFLSVGFKLRL